MIWLLLACGSSEPLALPNPPPSPPPSLAMAELDTITLTGQVGDIAAATRSWVLTGDGQRTVAVLAENGVLMLDGHAATIQDVTEGATMTLTGRSEGDVVLVKHAEVGKPTAAPVVPVEPVVPVPAAPVPAAPVPAASSEPPPAP